MVQPLAQKFSKIFNFFQIEIKLKESHYIYRLTQLKPLTTVQAFKSEITNISEYIGTCVEKDFGPYFTPKDAMDYGRMVMETFSKYMESFWMGRDYGRNSYFKVKSM